jgi:hypothetical protein
MGSITCMGSLDPQSCKKVESIHTFIGIDIAPIQAFVKNATISTSEGGVDKEQDLVRVTSLGNVVGRVAPEGED